MQNTRVLAVRVFGICDAKETLSDQVIILNYIMTHCNFLYDHIGNLFWYYLHNRPARKLSSCG